MSRWVVTQEGARFAVDGVSTLQELARTGRIAAGDLIRPPGGAEWLYAADIPELVGLIADPFIGEPEAPARRAGWAIAALALAAGAAVSAAGLWTPAPEPVVEPEDPRAELIVIADDARLAAGVEEPRSGSPGSPLPRETRLELLAKGRDAYRVRVGGAEGWVATRDVVPAPFAEQGEVVAAWDPVFNPDRYLWVSTASWMQPSLHRRVSVFQLALTNDGPYEMTGVVLEARIRDARGQEVERIRWPVEGSVPPRSNTLIGTLDPRTAQSRLVMAAALAERSVDDATLPQRWVDGVEVPMGAADFAHATVDIAEAHAVLPSEFGAAAPAHEGGVARAP
jgi:hypothetical protein